MVFHAQAVAQLARRPDQTGTSARKPAAIVRSHSRARLAQQLDAEKNRDVCVWYIQALGHIGPAGVRTLVEHSLDDADEEIRMSCLDQLIGKPTQDTTPLYVGALRSKDNVRINRAGLALGKLGDKTAIAPIDQCAGH